MAQLLVMRTIVALTDLALPTATDVSRGLHWSHCCWCWWFHCCLRQLLVGSLRVKKITAVYEFIWNQIKNFVSPSNFFNAWIFGEWGRLRLQRLRGSWISGVLHLLDDFLLIDKTFSACEQNLSRFLAICDDFGVPMAPEKTIGPSGVLCFAGIEPDTDKMEARLPEEKLRKCVTLKEMQSLIGLLNFTCSVVILGRTFLRRMINLTVGVNAWLI